MRSRGSIIIVILKYNRKDKIRILSGNVDNRSYVAADGTKKYFNNVVIFDFEIMATKEAIAGAADPKPKKNETPSKGTQYASLEDDEDDVPY